ncbi:Cold-inducible protein YdjO [Paenibacillus sp. UNC496MF]|uniref:cold-shock protein n=1 Tax=Paenibacillus sp. UNC496MF TaxID=1502753 RepID=UPI0008E1E7F4|nr:cold-shock protein [Paenibacillus sp. UNC496MF]SFI81228.1 Cold-inducible protein YdjO [Paenibacillus sp. UNC496MF]
MYNSRKRIPVEYPTEMTAIWSCTKDDCNGWMRQRYSFEDSPVCAQCGSPMEACEKELPILYDSGLDRKAAEKNSKTKDPEPDGPLDDRT